MSNPSIPRSEFAQRIRKTAQALKREDLECLVAFSCYPEREGHLQYLVNYHGAFPTSQHDGEYRGLGYSALIVSKDGEATLFPGLLFATGDLVGVDKVISAENLPLSVAKHVISLLKGEKNSANVGIAGADIFPYSYLEQIEQRVSSKRASSGGVIFKDSESILLKERLSKSNAEQKVMRRAAEIADKGIQAAFEATRAGARESDLGLAAAKVCYEEGVDYVARTRIYGRNVSGVRWPIMTSRRLESGEITGIDLIGYLNGYAFDVLRLWTVGSPSVEQKEFLGRAAALTENTCKKIRAGMTGDEAAAATLDVAKELKLPRSEIASPFGHAIGLEVVENPILLPGSESEIVKGALLCVEPSLEMQKSKQAVHFEDEILVGSGSPEVLSKCPKDLNS